MPETPRTLTAALHQEEDCNIAQCLDVDVASQGHTIDAPWTGSGPGAGVQNDLPGLG
jgi:hypothetical protein